MPARIVDPMGFAVNPAIVNGPVVLEVDQARQGQLRRWALAFLVLVVAACFNGLQRRQIVTHRFDIGDLQQARAMEEARARELRLEFESLRAPARIASHARDLNLVAPTLADVIVIERVERPEQPPSSVVASR